VTASATAWLRQGVPPGARNQSPERERVGTAERALLESSGTGGRGRAQWLPVSTQRRTARWQALGIGLTATVVVLIAYAVGGLDWLELKTLDLRFHYANSISERADLVCIDIDDAALGLVGRWPWARDIQAGVLGVLHEAGLKALLTDITLAEPEPLRTIVPRQVDIVEEPTTLLEAEPVRALPDLELQAALADFGQVYLATDYAAGNVWEDILRSDAFVGVIAALVANQNDEAAHRAAELGLRLGHHAEPARAPLLWARIVVALEREPTLDAAALARQMGAQDAEAVALACEPCRALALERRIEDWLDAEPARWQEREPALFAALEEALIPQSPAYGEALAAALREVLGYRATMAATPLPLERVRAAAPPVDAISPVYFRLARAARRCGFVVFKPDADGIMRRTRLLVQHGGRVLPQLAFAVALDVLELKAEDVTAEPGRLMLRPPGGAKPVVIQLDDAGYTLVPWVPQGDWARQFGEHVPVGSVWQIYDQRQAMLHNDEWITAQLGELIGAGYLREHEQYLVDLRDALRLETELRWARCLGRRAEARLKAQGLAEYRKLLPEGAAALRAAVNGAVTDATQPAGVGQALERLGRALAANAAYQAEIDATLARLRARLAGKIGLLGYTATALADMTPIPTSERAPGVVSHANLLNGMLSGRMAYWAPMWLDALLTVTLGMLATYISVRRAPRTAAVGLVLLIGLYAVAAGGVAFYFWTCWIALVPPIIAVAVSYVAVLLYRYVFLERESRQIATALGQYTSATLARKMAEDAELCRRAESREVTAVFTDLEGFTRISERIGAERTQHVLNLALGRFSDVILRHEGMINKFIGDGVFAFWNPVIYPQADHARRACEAAVDLGAGLRALIDEQRRTGGDEVFGELVLRVGIATGNAVVGPCGSEQKYDYTCIGDSVNVASRLESANKFYGTRILVSGPTYAQAGDGFVVRPLGGVRVKGKTQAVPIFELLGRRGAVPESLCRYADQFGAAVAAFQQRAWTEAWAAFEACLRQRPDDLAARQYAAAVQHFIAAPPPEDWSGALELTEK